MAKQLRGAGLRAVPGTGQGRPPRSRAEQERLWTAFYLYVDTLWDHVKARARVEADGTEHDTARDPAYSGVAGMRDLAAELVATVHEVQVSAGEETGR